MSDVDDTVTIFRQAGHRSTGGVFFSIVADVGVAPGTTFFLLLAAHEKRDQILQVWFFVADFIISPLLLMAVLLAFSCDSNFAITFETRRFPLPSDRSGLLSPAVPPRHNRAFFLCHHQQPPAMQIRSEQQGTPYRYAVPTISSILAFL